MIVKKIVAYLMSSMAAVVTVNTMLVLKKQNKTVAPSLTVPIAVSDTRSFSSTSSRCGVGGTLENKDDAVPQSDNLHNSFYMCKEVAGEGPSAWTHAMISELYLSTNPARNAEITAVLEANERLSPGARHVFVTENQTLFDLLGSKEGSERLPFHFVKSYHVYFVPVLTYNQLFRVSRNYPNMWKSVYNSDVYLKGLIPASSRCHRSEIAFVTSRHDVPNINELDNIVQPCAFYERLGSFDVFTFYDTPKETIEEHLVFSRNYWGVENVVAWALEKQYELFNTCGFMDVFHSHAEKGSTRGNRIRISHAENIATVIGSNKTRLRQLCGDSMDTNSSIVKGSNQAKSTVKTIKSGEKISGGLHERANLASFLLKQSEGIKKFTGKAESIDVEAVALPTPTFNSSCVPTALASYPGSGSTLTRILIEMVTGVWTGSVYGDLSLYHGSPHAFLGENTTKNVVGVKTHGPWSSAPSFEDSTFPEAKRAVLIVRNPQFALASWHNFQHGYSQALSKQHQLQAPKENWEKWRGENVPTQMVKWAKHFRYWMDHYKHPETLFLAAYEDIVDPKTGPRILSELSTFLDFPNSNAEAIWKAVMGKKSTGVHRKKTYTPELTNDLKLLVIKHLDGLKEIYQSNKLASEILGIYTRKIRDG